MSNTPWEVIQEAEIMCETLKTNRRYRPTEEQFQNTVDNCAPVDILRLLKTSNSLGTVMHSIVGHRYDDLVKCALEAVEGEDVFSLLMLTTDTSMTGKHSYSLTVMLVSGENYRVVASKIKMKTSY